MVYNNCPYVAAIQLDGHFDMPYSNLPTTDQRHHIVLTFDGVMEKIYIDGHLDNSQKMNLSSATEDAEIIIGASDIGEYFSGLISSFQMYDYALNEEEISQIKKVHFHKIIKKKARSRFHLNELLDLENQFINWNTLDSVKD